MKKSLIILGLVLLGVLAGLGYWWGKPAYQGQKQQRSLAQARQFLNQADYRNASLCLRQALVTNPENLEALRLMADLADLFQSPTALSWRKRVVDLEPNLTNRLTYAAAALRYEPPPYRQTAKILEETREQSQDNLAYHLVATQWAIKSNQLTNGLQHLREAIRLEPTNELHRMNLAVLELSSSDTNVVVQARATLERLEKDPRWGSQALRSLVTESLNRQDWPSAERFSQRLLASAHCGFPDRLSHLAVLQRNASPQVPSHLKVLQQEAGTNSAQVYQVVLAMVGLAMGAEALPWLRTLPEPMQKETPVRLAAAQAYLSLKDWASLENYISKQEWGDLEFQRLAMLARSQREQEAKFPSQMNWEKAVRLASERLELLLTMLQTVQSWNDQKMILDVLEAIVERYPSEQWAFTALDQIHTRQGNTAALYRLYKAWLERQPDDLLLKNNLATVALLLKLDAQRTYLLAREVYLADTNNYGFVSTYAYALHLQNKTPEALKLMAGLKPEHLQKPAIAAYYGTLLAASGQPKLAEPFLVLAAKGTLLPEERELVEKAASSLRR